MDERFLFTPTDIHGVTEIKRRRFSDARGSFTRLFCPDELGAIGWKGRVRQVNHSISAEPGTIRGMHYQAPPFSEAKIVTCLAGAVWDVAVDLRTQSPTYLKWAAVRLTPDSDNALYIPAGCAHGFQSLVSDTALIYIHDGEYAPQADAGFSPVDPALNIKWPLGGRIMSQKDQDLPFIGDDFKGLKL